MGTTLDVVWFARDHAFIAHAGDGRVYLARQRALLQLTTDHTGQAVFKVDGFGRSVAPSQGSGITNALGIRKSLRSTCCSSTSAVVIACSSAVTAFTPKSKARWVVRVAACRLLHAGRQESDRACRPPGTRQRDRDRDRNRRSLRQAQGPRSRSERSRFGARPTEPAAGGPTALVRIDRAFCGSRDRDRRGAGRAPSRRQSIWSRTSCSTASCATATSAAWAPGPWSTPSRWSGCSVRAKRPCANKPRAYSRVRADDFAEICGDPKLGSELYRRLAMHLARLGSQAQRRS